MVISKILNKIKDSRPRNTGNTGANTERDYSLAGQYWPVTQNTISEEIVFADGETTKTVQFTIRGDQKFDGTRSIVWITDENSNFGFDKELYVFNEAIAGDPNSNIGSSLDPAERFINSAPLDITLVLNSPIKMVTIIIEEDQLPNRIIKGSVGADTLTVPSNDFVNAQNRLPASKYGYAVYGFAGDDTIQGANGIDDLFGWQGNDILRGGKSSDYLAGNSGHDKLYGEDISATNLLDAGNDLLDGGAGRDLLFGGAGEDRLFGWTDTDILIGGNTSDKKSDLLYGEGGADYLYGGGGKDGLYGDSGADRFEFYNPNTDGWDYITDFNPSEDRIGIYIGEADKTAQIFRKSGLIFQKDRTLSSKQFVSLSTTDEANVKSKDADDRFLYNRFSGRLYFDRDGKSKTFDKKLIAVFAEPVVLEEPTWQNTGTSSGSTASVITDPVAIDPLQTPSLSAKNIVWFGDENRLGAIG